MRCYARLTTREPFRLVRRGVVPIAGAVLLGLLLGVLLGLLLERGMRALRPQGQDWSVAPTVPDGFSVTTIADSLGLDLVGFTFLPDGRILLINKQSGRVRVLAGGLVGSEPVFTVPRLAPTAERGLLGIAVDPDYPDSNYVYLFYTRDDSTNRVTRFAVQGDLTDPASSNISLDGASERVLMSLPDTTALHNGGTLRFGPDGKLYVSHGDDAYSNRVQSLSTFNGKIFRINRDGTAPDDNPAFPEAPADAVAETFAFGLRNPFRFSIDPHNGALFISDVGTDLYEELNLSTGGENFGFPHYEGPDFYRPWEPLIPPEPMFPIFAYPYDRSAGAGSAIALVAYRLVAPPADASFPPDYDGAYFYADFFDDEIRYLLKSAMGEWVSHSFGSGFASLVDGAIGPDGSVYVLEFGGELYRIAYAGSGVAVDGEAVPSKSVVHQNYPNPFKTKTTLSYD